MVKRTRLPKSARSRKQERLPELKQAVLLMSNNELIRVATASPEKKREDPILASLSSYAKEELGRRKELGKLMGKIPPRVPVSSPAREFALKFAEETEKDIREYLRLTKSALTGGFADELTKFMMNFDKIVENRLFTVKKRWEKAFKEHGLLRKNESDYLKAGFELKARLKYDIEPRLITAHKARFEKQYRNVIVIPVRVDNKRYYSVLVKTKR